MSAPALFQDLLTLWAVSATLIGALIGCGLLRTAKRLHARGQALLASELRKSGVLETAIDGMITIDEHGAIIDFNPAAERMFGWRHDEVRGRDMAQIIVPPALRAAHNAGMKRFRQTGIEQVTRRPIEFPALRRDGSEFPVEISIVPVLAAGARFFAATIRDISERRRLEGERQRTLDALSLALREREEQRRALDEHAIVMILDREGRVIDCNDKLEELLLTARADLYGSSARPLLGSDLSRWNWDEMWARASAGETWHGELEYLRQDGQPCWVACTAVPLQAGPAGEIGRINLIQTEVTAQKAAERELVQRREAELEIGSHIQRTLLLSPLPACVGNAAISTLSEASQGVDGDFFDLFELGPDCFDIVIGDVMGKGVPAALLAAAIKMQFSRSLAELFAARRDSDTLPDPAEILRSVHKASCHHLMALESFVTLSYLRVDLAGGYIEQMGCGHPEALALSSDGRRLRRLRNATAPLGVLADEHYVSQRHEFAAGDLIVMYTDGVTDATNRAGKRFGEAGLLGAMRRAIRAQDSVGALLQSIRADIDSFSLGGERPDDLTMIAIRLPQPGETLRRIELPRSLESLAELRRFISTAASAAELDEGSAAALELASVEALSNVILHARGTPAELVIEVSARLCEEGLEICIAYAGQPYTPTRAPEPDLSGHSEGGFGLYIIERSCDEVLYTHRGGINRIVLRKRRAPR